MKDFNLTRLKRALVLFSLSLFYVVPLSAQAPTWHPGTPSVSNIGPLSVQFNFGLNMTGTVYVIIFNSNVVSDLTPAQIKTWALAGPSGGRVVSVAIPVTAGQINMPLSILFDLFDVNRAHALYCVAESSGGAMQADDIRIPFTTLPCTKVTLFTFFGNLGECVNTGAIGTYQASQLGITPTGVLKGTTWNIDWGDGTTWSYTSTADNDIPPAQFHTYTSITTCAYEGTWVVRSPCGEFLAGRNIFVVHGRDIPADGDGQLRIVDNATGVSPILYLCEGSEYNVVLRDNSTWNCQSPAVPPPLNPADYANTVPRTLQWTYGRTPMGGIMNTISGNVIIDGTHITNSTTGWDGPVHTNQTAVGLLSDVITIPATSVVGQRYYVYLKNWNKCNPFTGNPAVGYEYTEFIIEIVAAPGAPVTTDQTICFGQNTTLTASQGIPAGTVLRWYSNADKTGFLHEGPTYTPTIATPGTYTYYVASRGAVSALLCEGPVTPVTLTVLDVIANNTIGTAHSICSGDTPNLLTGSLPTGGNLITYDYQWQISSDGVNFSPIAGANGQNYQPASLTATRYFRRVVTSGPCSSISNSIQVTVNPLPTITLGANPAACFGSTSANQTYSATTGSPNRYSIVWSAAAQAQGFVNVTDAVLPASPIPITIPAGAPVATYTFTLTVRNNTTGCVSAVYNRTLTINTIPTIALGANPDVCRGTTTAQLTYGATTGSPNRYSITWSAAAIAQGFTNVNNVALPASPISITVPAGAAVGTYTFTMTVRNSTTNCTSEVYNKSVTVNAVPTITLGTNPAVCQGTTAAPLTYTATSGSPNQYSIVWSAAALGQGFSNVTNAALPASPINLTVPAGAAPNTYTFTLTVRNTSTGCVSTGYGGSVTINANPTITLGANPAVCQGTTSAPLTYSATSGSPNRYSIVYSAAAQAQGFVNVNDAVLPASPISLVVPAGAAPATYDFTLSVRNSTTGCVSTSYDKQVTVNATPAITLGTNPAVCQGTTTSPLTYGATIGSPNQYSIVWSAAALGQGFANVTNAALPASPINLVVPAGANPATYDFTLTVRNSVTGCVSTTYPKSVTVHPLPIPTITGQTSVCLSPPSYTYTTEAGMTNYQWSVPTGGTIIAGGGAGNNFVTVNWTASGIHTVRVNYVNANNCTATSPTILNVDVGTPPSAATLTGNGDVCFGTASTFSLNITGGAPPYRIDYRLNGIDQAQVTGYNNNDIINLGTLTVNPAHTVLITKITDACGAELTINLPPAYVFRVDPIPNINGTTVNTPTLCHNGTTDIVLQSTVPATNFEWTVSNLPAVTWVAGRAPTGGTRANGNGTSIAQQLAHTGTEPVVVTYTITPTGPGATACEGPPVLRTVVVNPEAFVNDIGNRVLCAGAASGIISFTSNRTGGTNTFNWSNSNTAIGLGASGTGNIPSFTATNTTNSPITSTITVTPVYSNGGVDCSGPAKTFTITVNPTGQVNSVDNISRCHNTASGVISFSTIRAGGVTSYNWTNSNTSIGLAASGTGNIPSFTVTNPTSSPVTATIQVTPTFSNGGVDCQGTPVSFTITVNPTAQVNTVSDIIRCAGSASGAIAFSTNRTGGSTSFTWSNSNTAIGLGASGTGDIPSFVTTNTTNAPIISTITVTPTFNNAGIDCTGPSTSFTITVNPRGQVDDISNITGCSGSGSGAINFSTLRTGGTTTYTWTNSNTAIGLAASGSGNIPSFTLANSTDVPITSTIEVIPTFTNGGLGCPGDSKTFTVTVNPKPTLAPAGATVCSDEPAGITLSVAAGSVAAATYNIIAINNNGLIPSAGSPAVGTGFSANVLADDAWTNKTGANVNVVYTIVPVSGLGCLGDPLNVTVTVRPEPVLANLNTTRCSDAPLGFNLSVAAGSVAAATYNITSINPNGLTASAGAPATGTGFAANVIADDAWTNLTSAPVNVVYTIVPVSAAPCAGDEYTVTITVNPEPVGSNDVVTICSGNPLTYNLQNNINGNNGVASQFTYTVSSSDPVNVPPAPNRAAPSSDPITHTYTNTTGTLVTVTYTVTPRSSAGNCIGTQFTVQVIVAAQPVLANLNLTACSNEPIGLILAAAVGSVTPDHYHISARNVSAGLTPAGTAAIPQLTAPANYLANDRYINTTTGPLTVTYTIRPILLPDCFGDFADVVVTILPPVQPGSIIGGGEVCLNDDAPPITNGGIATGGDGNITYYWYFTENMAAMPGDGNWTLIADENGPTYDPGVLINSTKFVRGATDSFCPGEVFSNMITFTINPLPVTSPITGKSVVCENEINLVYQVVNTPGSTYSWTVPPSLQITIPSNSYFIVVSAVPGMSAPGDQITVTETFTATTGCVGPPVIFPVSVVPIVPGVLVNGPASVCQGDAGVIYSVPFNPGSTYTWTVPPGASITSNPALNQIEVTFNMAINGQVSVIENSNGVCTTVHTPVNVTVNPLPNIYNLTAPAAYCVGEPGVTITLSGSEIGVNYQLFNTLGPDGAAVPGTGAALTWINKPTETYHVVATNATTNCTRPMNGIVVPVINIVDGGTIGVDQTICEGTAPFPFSNVASATAGGFITYQWESSTDNVTFNTIPGATSAVYAPGVLAADTWYRRIAFSTMGSSICSEPSNTILVKVINFDPGSLTGEQTICEGSTPAAFVSVAATGDGTFFYQWYRSPDGVTYVLIPGAESENYDPGALTTDTWFRRSVKSVLDGRECVRETNAIKVTVINFSPGSIGGDQTICEGSIPAGFTSVPASGDGVFTYLWQYSIDNVNWLPAAGVNTNATYTAPALTVNTWFRRQVTATLNTVPCSAITNTILVTINELDPGTISTDQTICEGDIPTPFTSVDATGVAGAVITYQWEVSLDGVNFSNIPGATSATYSSGALMADTWFRRRVTSTLNGNQCTEYTNVVSVVVNNLTPGTIGGLQTICEGDTPAALTQVAAATGDGTLTYQWQISTTAETGPWTDILADGTGITYAPGALVQDTWYRRIVFSTIGANVCQRESNVIRVWVNNFDPGSIGSDQVICEGTPAGMLTSVSPTGDGSITYRWFVSTDGTNFNVIPGAIAETYSPGLLTEDRWYQREVTSTLNGHLCTEFTNVVYIQVNNFIPGSINGEQTICEGDTPVAFTSVTPTGDGTFTYQWQQSANGFVFTDIVGATDETHAPGPLTADTWYKRIVKSTIGLNECVKETNIIRVWVINFSPGSIGTDQTICEGTAPATFTSVAAAGDGVFTYLWESSTDNVNWLPAAGVNTNATYTAPALTVNTWFRRQVTATLNTVPCSAITNTILVTINELDPGTISTDQTICEGDIPTPFTSVDATGVAGAVITYQWEVSFNGVNYSNIPGATMATYSPEALMADTWFRRRVTSTLNGNQCTEYTNVVSVVVNNLTPGTIGGLQTICEGVIPAALTQVAAATGDGTLTYQWQISTTAETGPWTDILVDGTGITYAPGALTQDAWYRRVVISTIGANVCQKESNVIRVWVNNFDPGSIGSDQVICEGTPAAALTSVSPTGDGSITYRWFVSTDGTNFNVIPGAMAETYSPGILLDDRWYRREVTSTLNGHLCTELTNVVYIQVNNFVPGSINGEQTICEGDTPVAFTSVTPTGDGTFTYQWQQSANGFIFTDIVGATDETFAPGPLTADTWYKRIVRSTIGLNECVKETNIIRVTVINFHPGSIGTEQTICEGTAPATFTSVAAAGDGVFTYLWESSTDNVNWLPAAGVNTNATYTAPALTVNTWFRRQVTATLNTVPCSAITNTILVTINELDPGTISTDQTICEGDIPTPFTSVDATGVAGAVITYQWEVSLDGVNFSNIPGATSATYSSGALMADTWFRRRVTSTLNGNQCTGYTNVVSVVVNNLTPGTIGGLQTICEGDTPAALTQVAAATGDGTLTYQWQISTTAETGPWTDILVDGTGITYAPGALTQDTWYRRVVISTIGANVCQKESNVIRVWVNNFDPGSIGSDQVICEGTPAAALTSVSPTGDGSFTYRWFVSTDGTNFNVIPGAIAETYSPGLLTDDRWYRREVTSTLNGHLCTELTNVVYIQVNNFVPGSISGEQTICEGDTPVAFTSVTPTGDGTFTYQWQQSVNGTFFTDIVGATDETFAPGPLTADTWYKRIVRSTIGLNECVKETNIIRVTVINFYPGSIGSDQTICEGTAPATFTSVAPVGDGVFTFQWQESSDGVNFTDIPGAILSSYTSGPLTADTWFRRVVTATLNLHGCSQVTNIVKVTINSLTAGISTADQTICEGDVPLPLTSTPPTGTGVLTYQWQSSIDGVNFSNITGATSDTYSPPALLADTWYRLSVASSLNGNQCTELTNIVAITVINFNPGTIGTDQTICEGIAPAAFVSVAPFGDGTFTYQWQSSIDGVNFGDIAGATAETFTAPALTQDTWYRRIVTAGLNGQTCVKITNAVRVSVINFVPGSIAGDQTICENTAPVPLTSVTPTGDGTFTYRWFVSVDGVNFAQIPGAINETFSPGTLTQDRWYYREVTAMLNGHTCTDVTNTVWIAVNNLDAGSIAGEITICEGDTPPALTSVTPVVDGIVTYQWRSSTDGVNYLNIAGATSETFAPGALTQDTWYMREVTSTFNGVPCSKLTNAVKITVNNVTPGTIIADQTICNGSTPVPFSSVVHGMGDGVITYQWQSGTDGVNFTDIAGANFMVYASPPLTQDTWFRRVTSSLLDGVTCSAVSNVVRVTVNEVYGGTIGTDQAICYGTAPLPLTSTDDGSGTGIVTYQWLRSNNNVIFNTIPGETGPTYAPGVLMAETYFKRVLVSVQNGITCTAESNVITISINPLPIAILTGVATICPGESAVLNVNLPVGQAPFELEIENLGIVTGYNSDDDIIVSPLVTTTYRLLRVTDANGCEVIAPVGNLMGTATVTVRDLPVITDQPISAIICEYGIVTFSVIATGDDLTYQWFVNDGVNPPAPITDGGVYFGAQTSSLMLFGPTRLMDGFRFYAEVYGCGATETSAEATLTVNQVPEIQAHPKDSTICMGAPVSFTVDATGSGLVYEWQVKIGAANFVPVIDDGNITGSATATLNIASVPGSFNNYIFRVRISGICGAPVFSNFAFLRVQLPPVPTINPVNRSVCADGGPVYFIANGTGIIDSIRWQVSVDGVNWNDIYDNEIYSGTTSQQLALVGVPASYNGYRYRLALKAFCTTSYGLPATLTVNPLPVVDFSAIDPINLCGGVPLVLNGNPSGGSGVWTQHRWMGDIAPLNSFTTQNPTFFTTLGGDYVLVYTVTDNNGCRGSDTLTVRVEKPMALFVPSVAAGCTDLEVTFDNSMSTGYTSIFWNFGDGFTSTAENPTHTYVNNTGAIQFYDVLMRITSASGCQDSMRIGITVYPEVDAAFTLSADTICSGETVTLVAEPGALQYNWVYGDGDSRSGLSVDRHMYMNLTENPVTYTIILTTRSFFGCESTTSRNIVVYPMPKAEFTASPPLQVWPAATVNFTNLTNTGNWSYLWRFGDGNTSTAYQPTHTYGAPGNYIVTLIVSNDRCRDSISHPVQVLPTPPLASFAYIESDCGPLTVTLNNTSQYATTYLWDFGDGGASTAANPTYTWTMAGTYRVTLIAYGPGGQSIYDQIIEVYQTPVAYFQFTPERVYVNDERVRFFNLSQYAESYIWHFGDGDTSHQKDPFHKYMVKGIFDVTLHAYKFYTTQSGAVKACVGSYTASPGVLVEPAGVIRFATAFIPNKTGPQPDATPTPATIDQFFFPPVTEQVDKYKLQIFNRWGVLIFQSNDIMKGWDGYYKGRLVKQGVYVWLVEGKYSNGKPFRMSGDVTVLH